MDMPQCVTLLKTVPFQQLGASQKMCAFELSAYDWIARYEQTDLDLQAQLLQRSPHNFW